MSAKKSRRKLPASLPSSTGQPLSPFSYPRFWNTFVAAFKAVLFLLGSPWLVVFSILRYRSGDATLTAATGMSLLGLCFFSGGLWIARRLWRMNLQERAGLQASAKSPSSA